MYKETGKIGNFKYGIICVDEVADIWNVRLKDELHTWTPVQFSGYTAVRAFLAGLKIGKADSIIPFIKQSPNFTEYKEIAREVGRKSAEDICS